MKKKTSAMSCVEFQKQLPELIAAGRDLSEHAHVQVCDLCRALVADLKTIAEAARKLIPPDRR